MKLKQINFRVSQEFKDKIKKHCKNKGIDQTEFIIGLINDNLKSKLHINDVETYK